MGKSRDRFACLGGAALYLLIFWANIHFLVLGIFFLVMGIYQGRKIKLNLEHQQYLDRTNYFL